MTTQRTFTYKPEIQSIPGIRNDLRQLAGEWKLPGSEHRQLGLIIEELFSFTVRGLSAHSSDDPVTIALTLAKPYVTIRFEYGGPVFNPLEYRRPGRSLLTEEEEEGEMGLELVRAITDALVFLHDNGTNRLEIRKEIKKPQEPEYHG